MNTLHRVLLLVAALALPMTLGAQAVATGTVAGRVSDATTDLALGGVRVSVAGTAIETYTAGGGDYVLLNVPAGAQTLQLSYVGYPDVRRTVEVAPSRTTTVDTVFGRDVVQLEKYVITGSLVGTARAINLQRGAATLTSVVAADEIGRFPDENAAESIQRLPGVSLYRDQGEGRFIDLRGLNYIYTNVTLNGAKVASPEVGGRFMALDVVPSDSLAALEVTKVPTPDRDGEGLGGTVNIKTKSAFDADGFAAQFNAETIYSALTDHFGSKYNGSVSNLFADGKVGLLVAATWQERRFGSHNFEIDDGWELRDAPGGGEYFFLQDIAFRDYAIRRERYGASTSLEFRPDPLTKLAFKGTYNRFTDSENRQVSYIPFGRGTVTALDASSATVTEVGRTRRDLRNRTKDQELYAFSVDGERKLGDWTIDGVAATSRGHELKPSEIVARFRHNAGDTTYQYAFSDPYSIKVTKVEGPGDPNDPAFYERLDRVSEQREEGKETDSNIALNARLDFAGVPGGFVKVGGAYRTKHKESDADYWEYSAGPSSFTLASLAVPQGDYPYFRAPGIDSTAFRTAFTQNRAAFTGGLENEDSFLDDWEADEDVLAGYAMGGLTLGKTQLSTGVRVERTSFDTRGNELIDGGTPNAITAGRDYTNVLPGLFLRHDAGKQLVLRASYSTSLMRPEFSEAAIFRSVNTDDDEVSQGNPQLRELVSRNWDASVEYYLPSLGVVSAAVFYKRIEHFSYEFTQEGGDAIYPDFDLITFANGSDGEIKGLELAWQQQLRFLPAPFDGLGFLANATLADSEASYPTRRGEKLPFIGQSDTTGNLALTYEKHGVFARLALNYRSKHLREDEPIGGEPETDLWIDDYWRLDLSTAYRFSKQWEVFAEFTNLTDEPFRVYQTGGGLPGKRLVQFEEYDWTANIGLRWNL